MFEHFLSKHLKAQCGRPFICKLCGISFTKKRQYTSHVAAHNKEGQYQCHLCGIKFTTKGNLIGHLKNERHLKPEKSEGPTSLEENMSDNEIVSFDDGSENDEDINVSPTNQPESDEDVNDFVENLQVHSPQGSEASFMSMNTLDGYLDESIEFLRSNEPSHEDPSSVNKMNNFKVPSLKHLCNLCNKSFPSERTLFKHLNWIHNQCENCGKLFKRKTDLYAHLKTHDPGKLYQCDQCDKLFKTKYHLDMHVIRHSNRRTGKNQCIHCSEVFRSKSLLMIHMPKCENFIP